MIESFTHEGLRLLFDDDDGSQLSAETIEKIRLVPTALEEAETIDDLNQPSFRLHPPQGEWRDFWSVTVRANWPIVFRFEGDKAFEVDLVDYH